MFVPILKGIRCMPWWIFLEIFRRRREISSEKAEEREKIQKLLLPRRKESLYDTHDTHFCSSHFQQQAALMAAAQNSYLNPMTVLTHATLNGVGNPVVPPTTGNSKNRYFHSGRIHQVYDLSNCAWRVAETLVLSVSFLMAISSFIRENLDPSQPSASLFSEPCVIF